MFRIAASDAEARNEPLLLLRPGVAPPPRLSMGPASAARPGNDERHEPSLAVPPALGEADGSPVESQSRRRPFGPAVSLILHLLPLLLLLDWPMHPPAEVTPIPVQLVFQAPPPPPPPTPPQPKPKPKPETRPPPGRLASESLGDTQAKGRDPAKSDTLTAKKDPAVTTETVLEAPEQTAFLPRPPPLPDPPKLELSKPPDPEEMAPKPTRKPSLAAHQPIRPLPAVARLNPRPARYPGPAASRDEYLAYLAYLARQHIGVLRHGFVGGRRGETIINVLVLGDGTVAMLSVGLSSGYPDIDERVEQMIRAVGRFPPLPQWYQEPSMRLEFRLQFPEALED